MRKAKNRHFILSWTTGVLFLHNSPGQLAISFPYYSSNLPAAGEFNSTLGNSFTHNLLLQDVINTEFQSKHHSIDIHTGIISYGHHGDSTFSGDFFLAGGYSHNFAIGRIVIIKAGMDLTFYQFSRGLGNIDNKGADVYALGIDSGPTFTTTSTSGRTTVTHTHNTDHLFVEYMQNTLAVVPSIRITGPARYKLYWAIQASWFLPVIDKGGLNLSQVDSSGDSSGNIFRLIGLDQPDITATFNGRPVTHSPYALGGLYVGATVGICLPLWNKDRHV